MVTQLCLFCKNWSKKFSYDLYTFLYILLYTVFYFAKKKKKGERILIRAPQSRGEQSTLTLEILRFEVEAGGPRSSSSSASHLHSLLLSLILSLKSSRPSETDEVVTVTNGLATCLLLEGFFFFMTYMQYLSFSVLLPTGMSTMLTSFACTHSQRYLIWSVWPIL